MNITLTLIAQAVTFALFIWFTVAVVWPYLLRAIEARQKTIADGLAEAERGRNSLVDAKKESDRLLQEARDRAHEIVAQAEKQAGQRIEDAKMQAKTEGDRLVTAAQAQIEQEVQAAKAQLRDKVAELAVAGAEKILRREVDARAHGEMLGQLKARL
jgi:F-type H+-transporting ATPase subunit b